MGEKVVRLVDRSEVPTSHMWSGEQMLEDTLKELRANEFPQKVMIIGLDEGPNHFRARWSKAGIKNSEALALLELMKAQLVDYLLGRE